MPRDNHLIDALDALPRQKFEDVVWRVVREGRDPVACSASGGRWDDGSFDVLYTSRERDGAIAAMHSHLQRGQPVFPSRVRFGIHELKVSLAEVMTLTMDELVTLGLDTTRLGQLSYAERQQEYPRSQEIAEVANFLDCDGLLVPNARWECVNLVVFCDRLQPGAMEAVGDHGLVDWAAWQRVNRR